MKKNILFLFLILFGINVTYAGIRVGKQITDPTEIKEGDKILMRTGKPYDENVDPLIFKWVSALQDSLVWGDSPLEGDLNFNGLIDPYSSFVLEVSDEQLKGKPTYYLKNEFNGKYLKYIFEETVENEDGDLEGSVIPTEDGLDAQMRLAYTADKNEANAFAIVLASEGNKWGVNGEYDGEELPETGNVMICTLCKEYTDKELIVAINQAYGVPYAASYTDWGAWFNIYQTIRTNNYTDDLRLLYTKLAEVNFVGGTGPGTYDPELVANYDQAKKNAELTINVPVPEENACKEAYENLESAWLALRVLSAAPMKAGYYRIVNALREFKNQQGVDKAMYGTLEGQLKWKDLNKEDAFMGWEFIDRNDGTWILRNIGSQLFVTSQSTLGKDSTDQAITVVQLENGDFNIKYFNETLHAESHGEGAGKEGNIVSWGGGTNTPSAWFIQPLSKDTAEMFLEFGKQNKRDEDLANLIDKAKAKYDIGSSYTYDRNDSLLISYEQLRSNAAQLSNDDEYTNVIGSVWGTSKDGGGYPALLDGNKMTFFHSAWQGSIAADHYLDLDLKKEVKSFIIAYAKRGNSDSNMPKAYEIYTAAADADTSKMESWTLLRSVKDQPLDLDTVYSKGFEPGESCRYVRFIVKETKSNAMLNNHVYFALGGMQVYVASMSEKCFNGQNVEFAQLLKEAIDAACQVKVGETTQEDIDKLQVAYDAYCDALPDPTLLKETYKEAETTYNQAVTETTVTATGATIYPDPGTYRDADKELFKAELNKVKAYIEENDANGTYTSDGLTEQIQILENAEQNFKKTIRWINAADADQEGTWYHIAGSNRYFDVTGAKQDKMRQGILYVKVDQTLENATLYWGMPDSIAKQNIPEDNAKWRFINLGDSAYAIQNAGTKLYVGQYQTRPASLSASPVAFKISEIGYGTFLFKGVFFDGQDVWSKYLHAEGEGTKGGYTVYWDNSDLGDGSAWDIYTTDRSEEGVLADDITNEEISDFSSAQLGKLYTMCYPVGIEYIYDSYNDQAMPFYGIAGISETELTLVQKYAMEPGEPFFYLAGDDQSLLEPNPTGKDSVRTTIKLSDFKSFAQKPLTVNGLVGNYYSGYQVPAGMGYLKETTKGKEGAYTERIQTIEPTTENQTMGWNSAYINASLIENTEPAGRVIKIKINGELDTAVKHAIVDAQKGLVDVYSIDGVLIKSKVKYSEATKELKKGLYIIDNKKVIIE